MNPEWEFYDFACMVPLLVSNKKSDTASDDELLKRGGSVSMLYIILKESVY